MLAAYHGHADLVKLLIEHGADPNRVNDRGQSPLAGAVFKKEDAVIEVCVNIPSPPRICLCIEYLFSFGLYAKKGTNRLWSKAALTRIMGNQPPWSVSPCFSRKMYGRPSLRQRPAEARESRRRLLYNYEEFFGSEIKFSLMIFLHERITVKGFVKP